MAKQQDELIQIPNYQQIKQNFLQELTLAHEGKPSSISFLKHRLPEKPLLNHGIVQGIVIGGTNFINLVEEIQPDGSRKNLKKETGLLPIFDTRETVVSFFSEHIDPQADAVGINFGFPMEAMTGSSGELDSKLLRGTKEHAFKGLLNKPLGQLVKDIYQQRYHKTPMVSVANDTICLTLSGDGSENGSFVAGTGFNACLVLEEKNKKILVNLESGNFNKFNISPILRKIDGESEDPGGQLLEKMTAGRYLAQHFNETINELGLSVSPMQTSEELSELSNTNHTDVAGELARAIITRSAFLVASAIAGLYEFSNQTIIPSPLMGEGQGEGETSPKFILIGEGSLLWHGWQYHENIQKQLSKLGIPEGTITIKHIPDSSIKGALGLITQ